MIERLLYGVLFLFSNISVNPNLSQRSVLLCNRCVASELQDQPKNAHTLNGCSTPPQCCRRSERRVGPKKHQERNNSWNGGLTSLPLTGYFKHQIINAA